MTTIKTVKASLWLTSYGVQALAVGRELDAAHFSLLSPSYNMESEGWHRLSDIDIVPPSRKGMTALALQALDKEEKSIREKWQKQLLDLHLQRSKLQAIEGPSAAEAPAQSAISDLDDADAQQLSSGKGRPM